MSFISGKDNIRPEDPEATNILGNIRLEHVGHPKITASAPVEQLLERTTRTLAYKSEAQADGIIDTIDALPATASDLPLPIQ